MIRLLSSSRFVAWSAVGLWTAMIFISVPLVRGIREPVAERIGASTFGWITLCGLLVATAAAGYFALQRARRLPLRNLFALLAVCAIAVGVTL
ncbi:MAG: hypothetical protein GY906_26905, partial [bacterium]|nr:hypothetical protein [bacterium]